MAQYKRGQKIGTGWNYREAALGSAGTKGTFTDKDFGKPLKLAADSTYDVCADGDEIEEIFEALAGQQPTVNDGFQIGTIRNDGTALAISVGTIAIGNIVVAAAQAALGTLNNPAKPTTAYAKVKVAGDAAAQKAVTHKWRVVSIQSGGGADGSIVLIERV